MTDLRDRLRQAFRQEHREYLEGIRAALDTVAAGGALDARALDELCRQAHSLKGAAHAVDLPAVVALAHRLETLFDRVRQGGEALDRDTLDLARAALDLVEDLAGALDGTHAGRDAAPVLARLDARLGTAPVTEAPSPAPPPKAPEPPAPTGAVETLRVEAAGLDRLLETGGELVAETRRQAALGGSMAALSRQAAALEAEWGRLRRGLRAALPAGDADTAPALEQFEQHLRACVQAVRAAQQGSSRAALAAGQLGQALQGELARLRLVEVDTVFGAMGQVARDIALGRGLEPEVRLAGLSVRADRLVLQRLRDPVLQLLRNAIGHGLEPAAERQAKGKPPQGKVTLSFEAAGGQLLVRVADDGRGLDTGRLWEAGLRLGLLSPGGPRPSEEALLRLVFTPGFSTSPAVTTLAGRGMGLSIVAEAAARLGGTAQALNRLEGGAEFRLSVPVGALSQELLLVRAGGRLFGIPADGVERLYRARPGDRFTREGRAAVRVGGDGLPLDSLAARLGLPDAEVRAPAAALPVLVLKGARRAALACDGFVGLRHGLVKDLGAPLPASGLVSGGVLLEDGRVALVLNPAALAGAAGPGAEVRLAAPEGEKRVPTILVVDDSLTTRTLQKSVLEAYGYHVRMAIDGVQALKRLRAEPADLVITDVQMPQLDGFGLLAAIRDDPALSRLPVILVTSLEKREDKARGLALGADAYIVKQEFDQEELLATIRQLT